MCIRDRDFPARPSCTCRIVWTVHDLLPLCPNHLMLRAGKPCEDCLREMESYEWVNDGSGHDVPRKENDHAMDEMRYFAMSVAAGHGTMPTACAVTRTTNWRGAAER